MSSIIDKIRLQLIENSNDENRKSSQTFFKEEVKPYGVNTALVSKIAKDRYKEIVNIEKDDLFDLCEELWQSGYLEESFIACAWSQFVIKKYEKTDFIIFEKWLDRYVSNWASCDTFCNHTIGSFLEKYPEYVEQLQKWAVSPNRWMRRASAVSLIIPAKKGGFLPEIFGIADTLLLDGDDMVQKGYGWLLKAASHTHQKDVFDYVLSKKAIMPRTALRYAIEKMPVELRQIAMAK